MPKLIKNNRKNRRNARANLNRGINAYGRIVDPQQGLFGGTEMKHADFAFNTNVSTTPAQYILSNIGASSSVTGRTGNIIHVKRIDVQFVFNPADAVNFMHTYLLCAYNGQAAIPSFSLWFIPPDSDQYLILKHKTSSSGYPSLNTSSLVSMKHTFPGNGLQLRFDTDQGSSLVYNQLSLVWITDSAAGPHPSVTGYARVFYQDA